MKPRVFIIAEAGVNHNGDVERALRLIEAAAEAEADAVKFQSFRVADLVTQRAQKADYQVRTTPAGENQLEMLRKLELTEEAHEQLLAHARACGIGFLSSPFDHASLRFLTERLGLDTIKIASGEITNAPLLLAVARSARTILLSTGMSTLAEVEAALSVLAWGFLTPEPTPPGRADLARAFASEAALLQLRQRVTLLHCTTEYPAPIDQVNLRAMDTLAAAFQLPVGYSDHTPGLNIALAAVARGARVLEKHFTLDRSLPGPDHAASLEPPELRMLVQQARQIEQALGDGLKRPGPAEFKNRDVARKSVVASRPVAAGETLSEENITCKRPGGGVSPFDYWSYLGRIALAPLAPDDPVDG